MKYADPNLCISCRAELTAPDRCGACGLDLTSTATRTAWAALASADQWLAQARANVPLPKPAAQPVSVPLSLQPRKPIDAGAVLLVLGALFILVAGSILSALALGVFALPLMTVVAGGLAIVADRRHLPASAETLIGITILMGSLSVGIFAWDSAGGWVLWGLLGVLACFAFLASVRPRTFVVPQLSLALFATVGAFTFSYWVSNNLALNNTDEVFWAFLLGSSFIFAPALVLTTTEWAWARRAIWLGGVIFGFALWGVAVTALFAHPAGSEFFAHLAWAPLAVVALGMGVTSFRSGATDQARSALLGLALLHLLAPWFVFTLNQSPRAAVAFALVASLVLFLPPLTRGWIVNGTRGASLTLFAVGAILYALALSTSVTSTLEALQRSSHLSWHEQLVPADPSWWLYCLAAALVVLLLGLFVRDLSGPKQLPLTVGLLQVPLLACTLGPSMALLSCSILLAAVFLALTRHRVTALALALLLLAPAPALLHAGLTGILAALVTALLLAAPRWLPTPPALRPLLYFSAPVYGVGAVLFVSLQAQLSSETTALLLVAGIGVGLAASTLLHRHGGARYAEAGLLAWSVLLFPLLVFEVSTAFMALVLLLLGAAHSGAGLLGDGRLRWAGAAFIVLSWWARLSASSVEVWEAYTAPLAVGLLALGVYRLMRRPAPSLAVLTPGLLMGLAPSALLVLADPVSGRALILTLVGLAVLAWGLRQALAAPFYAGSAVLAMIAVVEMAPYVMMMQRWILLVAVGVVLALAGATWEARVKDGRAVARYLSSLK